jgi:glycosyltransferase 2 family protein
VFKKIIKLFLFLAGFTLLLYIFSNAGISISILSSINIPLFILAFTISIISIIIKIYRWRYLSDLYHKSLTMYEASFVTIPALFFTNITPGKIGEYFKAHYMKTKYNLDISHGITMIFYERFSEILLMLIISFSVIFVYIDQNIITMLLLFSFGLVIVSLCYYKIHYIINIIKTKIKLFDTITIEKLPIKKIGTVFIITACTLLCEFTHLWIIAYAFGYNLNFIELTIFSSITIIIAFISQIPFGMGIQEGSLTYFITKLGVPVDSAASIVLCDRIISMYFAMVIGFIYSKYVIFDNT